MPPAAGSALALLLLCCCGWTAYLAALRLPSAPMRVSLRLACAAAWALWLQIVLFTALGAADAFRLGPALAVWLLVAGAAQLAWGRGSAWTQLLDDLRAGARLARRWVRSPVRAALLLAVAGLFAHAALIGTAAPPLGWDALVYHYYNPARWIQDAAHSVQLAPDGSGHYEFYPHAGSIVWAWAMLPVHGDALLALAGIGVWAACGLGGHAFARALGAAPIASAYAALAIALTPCVARAALAGNADNLLLASFLIASALLVHAHRAPGPASSAGAGAALGAMAAIKVSALLPACLGLLLLARKRRPLVFLAAVAAAAAAALPGYLRALWHTGNPFHPIEVRAFGRVLFAGNEGFRAVLDGTLFAADPGAGGLVEVLQALARPAGGGFGPGPFLLLPLAALGLFRLLRRSPALRAPVLAVVVMAAYPFAAIFGPDLLTLRTVWLGILGRLVTPLVGVVAVLAAQGARGRLAEAVWCAVLLVDLALAIPTGVGEPIQHAAASLAGAAALALGAAALPALAMRHLGLPRVGLACAAAVLVLGLAPRVAEVRSAHRYAIWADAMRGGSHVLFPLDPAFAAVWPIWELLDDGAPHQIALASGWNGVMHNGYRYPLLGSRLQNRVHYVPVALDGELVDYRLDAQLRARADFESWMRRLAQRRIEYVVVYAPPPIEAEWMRAHPELFELVPVGPAASGNAVYRFRGGGWRRSKITR